MLALLRIAVILMVSAVMATAAPVYSTATTGGVTTDFFDLSQGTKVIWSSNQHNGAGQSDVRQIFGLPSSGTWVEPGNAIFADGAGPGSVDYVEWQTADWIHLAGFELRMAQDGPGSAYRGCGTFKLFASQDGVNFSQVSGGSVPLLPGGMNVNAPLLIRDTALTGVTANVRAFRLEITRLTTGGPRVVELDGFGSPGVQPSGLVFLDRLAFNASSNTYTGRGAAARDDEGTGPVPSFSARSRVLGTDLVEDAFGNKNGAVEPESFIFGDAGEPDNGDLILGNGGETVDFLSWQTPAPTTIAGMRLQLSGDGISSNRDTEMVQILVEGHVVDCFDNNGFDGLVTRIFPDGPVTGDDFRVEFTRTVSSGGRLFDIDALTSAPVTHSGSVVLNELCAENHSSLEDEDGDSPDWLELYNSGDTPVDLTDWGLTDSSAEPFKWRFPAGTALPGREFLLVFLSDKNRIVAGLPLHANFQIKAAGESVLLTRPDGTAADAISPVHLAEDTTIGRFPNGTGAWKYFLQASPEKTNTLFQAWDSLIYEKPDFSVLGGAHATAQSLILSSAEPSVTIRYTLDGSEPTETSPEFLAPLAISSKAGTPNVLSMIQGTATANQHTDGWKAPVGEVRKATIVRTRAFRSGAPPGPVGTQTYFVGADGPRTDGLPTLSLTTAPSGLFDYNSGIYMLGRIFDDYVAAHPGEPLTGHTPANYTQRGAAWARATHLEWFEPFATRQWGEPVELDIQGQSSRSFRQKSFGIKARGAAGQDNSIGYPIFPGLRRLGSGEPLEDFRHLRLRNYGNDWDYAMMRDSWCHRLIQGFGIDVMSSRPAAIYLDGEYWGILEVRENQDPRYLQAHYGFNDDDAVILYGHGALESGLVGDAQPYLDLNTFCETHNLANQADYDYVTERVDAENCLRYYLAEIYFANADWPQNNIRLWRRRLVAPDIAQGVGKDGRWRWFLFDVDLGAGHPWSAGVAEDTLAVALAPNGRPQVPQSWGTAIFRSLMTNPGFRMDFINTAADLLNSYFSPSRAVALVNQMEAELLPGMDEHRRRWQPGFGSVAGWQAQVAVIRNFAQQRAVNMRQHFLTQFSLAGSSVLTVDVAGGASRGSVQIGRLLVDANLPGTNPVAPYPWSGTYFRGIPLQLTALAKPGWIFTGWSGAGTGTEPLTSLTLSADAAITAHFIAEHPVPQPFEFLPVTSQIRLHFTGTPSAPARLEVSDDLASWTAAGDFTLGLEGTATLTVPAAPQRRFFRAISLP